MKNQYYLFSDKKMSLRSYFGEVLLTAQGQYNIKQFSYKGGDASLVYKYVLGPMAEFCVNYIIPPTIAPNLITIIAS